MHMSKIKYIGAIGGVLGFVFVVGLGLWVWSGHNQPKRQVSVVDETAPSSNGQTLNDSYDPNSIPLNQVQPKTSSSGGLSVVPSSPADNMGQINPTADTSTPSSQSAKKSQPSPIDPTTFSQYDKYKEGSGALFGEIQAGNGAELGANMKAAVFYKGWLTNGQLFDQSRPNDKGEMQPFVFTLGAHQVIPGWEQALAGMKVGGTRLVIVPPAVGYGAAGQGPIPGNAVLVFQVQLAAVQ